jgi:hypothetical protein
MGDVQIGGNNSGNINAGSGSQINYGNVTTTTLSQVSGSVADALEANGHPEQAAELRTAAARGDRSTMTKILDVVKAGAGPVATVLAALLG